MAGTMPLPNGDQSIVPQRKIVDYLLSDTHRDGRSKAVFFSSCGFSVAAWEVMASALRQHALMNDVVRVEATPFGTSYAVDGPLMTPSGRQPRVRVIWFVPRDQAIPVLVTAFPRRGGGQ
jgi:hypothetical protein